MGTFATFNMSEKSEDRINISKQFFDRTKFPNYIGAVDGKHVRIKQPQKTGSEFYNYKNFFSLVILTLVDADYCFISIDVGSCGGHGDSNIFKNSSFGRRLSN